MLKTKKWILICLPVSVVVLAFSFFETFMIARVNSHSMLPNYNQGDFVLTYYVDSFFVGIARDLGFRVGQVSQGDVILFREKDGNRYYLKRVMATGGNTIEIQNNTIIINSKILRQVFFQDYYFTISDYVNIHGKLHNEQQNEEEFITILITQDSPESLYDFPSTRIPNQEIFVLSDNRNFGLDSRSAQIGTIDISQIVSVTLF